MAQLFLSYRRDDAAADVGRLRSELSRNRALRDAGIFVDIHSIAPGVDFRQRISTTLAVTDVFVPVIGPDWLDAATAGGKRRLDQQDDPVRNELELALQGDVPTVPVLVRGATMPRAGDLPESLRALAPLQAAFLTERYYDVELSQLIGSIRRIIEMAPVRDGAASDVSADDLLAVGLRFFAVKDYRSAVSCLRAAAAKNPELARAHAALSGCAQLQAFEHADRRNFGLAAELLDEADQLARTAIGTDNTDPWVLSQVGYVRKETAQFYLRLPGRLSAYAREAQQHDTDALLQEAEQNFEMALTLDPADPSARNGMGTVALILEDYDAAIDHISRVLDQSPGYAAARYDLATAYYAKARRAEDRAEKKQAYLDFAESIQPILEQQQDPDAEHLAPQSFEILQRYMRAADAELKSLT